MHEKVWYHGNAKNLGLAAIFILAREIKENILTFQKTTIFVYLTLAMSDVEIRNSAERD